MKRSRLIAVVGALCAGPALAAEPLAESPYGQVRSAVEQMDTILVDLDLRIERRHQRGRGKALECLEEHRAAIASLRDLARIQRAHLVEAMADGDPRGVESAHRNVMLWHIKARVHEDSVGACPTQQEYDLEQLLAEINAPLNE